MTNLYKPEPREVSKRPKIPFRLVGEDGNSFSILGRFSKAAKRSGWYQSEINEITSRAISGGYDNLLNTIIEVTEEPDVQD